MSWESGSWGAPMWGFWWIFPLVGMLVCLAFIVIAFRALGSGHGFMCMGKHGGTGGHPGVGNDETAELRREIGTLREELERLKASR